MRAWTHEWWRAASEKHSFVTSDAVLDELEATPEPKRTDCLLLL